MAQNYELNLRDYWGIFKKRKFVILFLFLIVFGSVAFYTNIQQELYRASATIRIEPESRMRGNFSAYNTGIIRKADLIDYSEHIGSSIVVEKTLRELGLIPKGYSEDDVSRLVSEYSSRFSSSIVQRSHMIEVAMVSPDPKIAQSFVNKAVNVFKAENIRLKNREIVNVKKFLQEQLEKVSKALEVSENKLKKLTIRDIGRKATAITKKITKLEEQKTDLLMSYTESHPNVKKVDEEIALLKDELRSLPSEEFEFARIKRDISINEKLYNNLRANYQTIEIRESEKLDNIVIVKLALLPQQPFSPNKPAGYTIGMLLGIVLAIGAALLSEHLDTSIGRIEDLESITKVNVLGVIPYFIDGAKEAKKISKKKDVRLYKLRAQAITSCKENSIYVEAFRILGANLQVVFGEHNKIKNKVILITSSNPLEGKSVVSSNLAIIMAQMGYKTVLLDMDLRRSTQHKIFGIKSKEGGVTDILTGKIRLEQAVRTSTGLFLEEIAQKEMSKNSWMNNFSLITAGKTFPNSAYLLNTDNMDNLLRELRTKYEVIIIDSSPVLAVSDTSIISPRVDGVILVYRSGATSRMALRRTKQQVDSTQNKDIIKGIVMNNVTPDSHADPYYYYYRGRYYNYGEESGKIKS